MVGLTRHGGEGTRITAVRTDDGECSLRMQSRQARKADKKKNELDRNAKAAQFQRQRPQADHLDGKTPKVLYQE